MKKTIYLILCCMFMVGSLGTISYAATGDDYVAMPRFNNTATTNTDFTIDGNGKATIQVSFVGYEGITTGATIKVKLQKKFLFFFWQDVDIGTNGKVLQYEVTGDYCFNSYTLSLSKGTYRVQAEYEIRGTGGSADVITEEVECSY